MENKYGDVYAYLIGWSSLNKWYYGIRYGQESVIGDIWQTYFTSSKVVKLIREMHGDPDVVQVRKTFSTPEQAINWEARVLRRMDVTSNTCWLNISCRGHGINTPPNHSNKIWINDTIKNKRIYRASLPFYEKKGWVEGRLLTGAVKFYQHGNRRRCPTTGRFLGKEQNQ